MLPKFLLADNSQELPDTIFIVHTQQPKFIVEGDVEDLNVNQTIHWIDDVPSQQDIIEDLLDQAEEFLNHELDNQEDLYDDEFED